MNDLIFEEGVAVTSYDELQHFLNGYHLVTIENLDNEAQRWEDMDTRNIHHSLGNDWMLRFSLGKSDAFGDFTKSYLDYAEADLITSAVYQDEDHSWIWRLQGSDGARWKFTFKADDEMNFDEKQERMFWIYCIENWKE